MSEKQDIKLSDLVRISRHYQRSIKIDIDLGRSDALDGYICHGTSKAVLENMSKQLLESNQRAFTWTGPFGGGKSSLAVAFASALGTDKSLRTKAREVLQLQNLPAFDRAITYKKGWLTVPIVGRRASVVAELSKGLRKAQGFNHDGRKVPATSLIEEICEAADSRRHDGVLIVIDEMGYVAIPESAAELLFQVIAGRAEKAAVIVTTNLPFSEWTTMFPNARLCKAMLDRLTDQAHIIETGNESYRFRRTLEKRKCAGK